MLEIVHLAVASNVRPTSVAAVGALLSTASPRRLLIVYIATGLAFTIGFGIVVMLAFHGVNLDSGNDRTKSIVEIVAGSVALAFAVCILTGLIGGSHPNDAPKAPSRWNTLFERGITMRGAALAGPVTHIPGVFYLIVLNLIVVRQATLSDGVLDLLVYNAIWFAIPLTALTVCVVKPSVASRAVGAVDGWVKAHARAILLVVTIVVGVALVVRGALELSS